MLQMKNIKLTLQELLDLAQNAFYTLENNFNNKVDNYLKDREKAKKKAIMDEIDADNKSNEDEVNYISKTIDEDSTLADIISKLPDWRKMKLEERKNYATEILSYALSKAGVATIGFAITDNMDENNLGGWAGDEITLSKSKVVSELEPYQMFETLQHETRHFKQYLASTLTKKSTKDSSLYFPMGIYPNESIRNSKLSMDLYQSDIAEQDSNIYALYQLYNLSANIGLLRPNSIKYHQEQQKLKKVADVLEQSQEDFLISNIKVNAHPKIITDIQEHFNTYTSGLIGVLQFPIEHYQNMPEEIDEKFSTSLQMYLEDSSNKELFNQESHAEIVSNLHRILRIEALQATNIVWYEHTPEDLSNCISMLKEVVGEGLLVPTAFKYLTHIDGGELMRELKSQMDSDVFRISSKAMVSMLDEKSKELNITKFEMFGKTIDLDPNNANHLSYMINNFFPQVYSCYYDDLVCNITPHVEEKLNSDYIIHGDEARMQRVSDEIFTPCSAYYCCLMDNMDTCINRPKNEKAKDALDDIQSYMSLDNEMAM